MFLKKKLKIYLIMLSVLSISAPINAMKKNEIIIKINNIKSKNFEEENSKDNIKIENDNDKDISFTKEKNLEDSEEKEEEEYEEKYKNNIEIINNNNENISFTKEKNLEDSEEKEEEEYEEKYKKNVLESNIEINKIKKEIDKIKKIDSKILNINNLTYYIYELEKNKKNLFNLKEEAYNEETINTIDNMLYENDTLHNELTILKIKKEIDKIKEIDFNNEDIFNVNCHINNLNQYKQDLLISKQETNNEETIKSINSILDEINKLKNELIVPKIKKEIDKIKKEIDAIKKDFEIENIFDIRTYIFKYGNELRNHEQYLLNLKEETDNEETIKSINSILDEINKLYKELIIPKIEKEIDKIKKIDFDNEDIFNVNCHINNLNQYKQALLVLKQETNNKETKNTINNMLDEIKTLHNKLIISKTKKEIDAMKKDFDNENIFDISAYIFKYRDKLRSHEQYLLNLLNLKEETDNEETINSIDSMLDEIDKLKNELIIPKIEKEIDKIKKIDFKILNINNLTYYICELKNQKKNLLFLKQETNNEKTINAINSVLDKVNNIISEFNELIIEKIEKEIEKIKENFENEKIDDVNRYIKDLNDYKERLLNLKNETINKKILDTINYILKNIDKLFNEEIFNKKSNLYTQNLKTNKFENIYKENIQQYQKFVNTLKFYKLELLNLKKETNNKKTIDIIDNEINNIDESIINSVRLEANKLEKEYLKRNNKI